MIIETNRLKLIPATAALARAELADRNDFSQILGASVPDNWPPETLKDVLPEFLAWMEETGEQVGWYNWYALSKCGEGILPVLVGSGGFIGSPVDGTVEIGYSILPQYMGQGYATELVTGLVRWALEQPGVSRVAAETEWANPASVRVLIKAGFVPCGAARNPNGNRFEIKSTTD